jgi:maleylpyruvate isomerase
MDEILRRRLSDRIDDATQRLLSTARLQTDASLREPSLLPGWSRAYVLAHLARGADAMRAVLVGARTGRSQPGYASQEAHAADTEASAKQTARELSADVAAAAMALRTIARQLPAAAWATPVGIADADPFPAGELLVRRLVEVELHHADLDAGYGPGDWPLDFAAIRLGEPMQGWRTERLNRVSPAQTP